MADTSEHLRREQAERARQEVVAERVRIARELHDIVAHHMSVISVHAGMAGYVFDAEPDTARKAVGVIADNSREAQEELRRMLSPLRTGTEADDDANRAHPPRRSRRRSARLRARMPSPAGRSRCCA